MYRIHFKRVLDFFVALLGLLVLSPLLLIVAVCLTVVNKGNPFFVQVRPGKNEKLFNILKFKTMTDEKDKEGNLLPDAKRLTKIGRFIRKTSLDELPQLVNVLKGEMSLIGPRPLLPEYLSLYDKTQKKRHLVRPGITGWAQVNGRNAIEWQQKFEYDVWYVENISFLLDLKILWKTIRKVLIKEGISAAGGSTMPRFDELRKNK